MQTAQLLIRELIRHHGIPRVLRTDRDRRVTSQLWIDICKGLAIKPTPTVSFHPRANGAVERVNSIISQQLRIRCAQSDDWVSALPATEMAINSRSIKGTVYSPWYLNFGYHPTTIADALLDVDSPPQNEEAKCFVLRIQNDFQKFQKALQTSEVDDIPFRDPTFKLGDEVFVKFSHRPDPQHSARSKHLRAPWQGLFPIIEIVSDVTYRLKLPASFGIHDVFHESSLRKFTRLPAQVEQRQTQRRIHPNAIDRQRLHQPQQSVRRGPSPALQPARQVPIVIDAPTPTSNHVQDDGVSSPFRSPFPNRDSLRIVRSPVDRSPRENPDEPEIEPVHERWEDDRIDTGRRDDRPAPRHEPEELVLIDDDENDFDAMELRDSRRAAELHLRQPELLPRDSPCQHTGSTSTSRSSSRKRKADSAPSSPASSRQEKHIRLSQSESEGHSPELRERLRHAKPRRDYRPQTRLYRSSRRPTTCGDADNARLDDASVNSAVATSLERQTDDCDRYPYTREARQDRGRSRHRQPRRYRSPSTVFGYTRETQRKRQVSKPTRQKCSPT